MKTSLDDINFASDDVPIMSNSAAQLKPDKREEKTLQDADRLNAQSRQQTDANYTNDTSSIQLNEMAQKFANKGLNSQVAFQMGKLVECTEYSEDDIDDRCIDVFKGLRTDHAVFILTQMQNITQTGIVQKAIFLSSMIRNFRDRCRTWGPEAAMQTPLILTPDKYALQELLDRTGYRLEVTVGQRKYGGPPPGEPVDKQLVDRYECYVGHLPKDVFEDTIVPLFEKIGRIWDVRIMMDNMTGGTRGYAFVTFEDPEVAKKASEKLNNTDVNGRQIVVNCSKAQTRVFIGNIPKDKDANEIKEELKDKLGDYVTDGIKEVIIYAPTDDTSKKNRGFCFVEFEQHKNASDCKRKIAMGKAKLWGVERLAIDWAESPDQEVTKDYLNTVKTLYVRNVKDSVSEDSLKEAFEKYGEIEKIQKIKDFAFIHYKEKENADAAYAELKENPPMFDTVMTSIDWARPPSNKPKRITFARGGNERLGGGQGGFGGGGNWGGGYEQMWSAYSGGNWDQSLAGPCGYGDYYRGGYTNETGVGVDQWGAAWPNRNSRGGFGKRQNESNNLNESSEPKKQNNDSSNNATARSGGGDFASDSLAGGAF